LKHRYETAAAKAQQQGLTDKMGTLFSGESRNPAELVHTASLDSGFRRNDRPEGEGRNTDKKIKLVDRLEKKSEKSKKRGLTGNSRYFIMGAALKDFGYSIIITQIIIRTITQ